MLKKLISGFHISLVDLNNCLRKRRMLWERFVPSRTEHWADPLTWKALFITLPAFPKQLSACPCMLSMFSHRSSLYTSPCRGAEKKGKAKKSSDFLFRVSQDFFFVHYHEVLWFWSVFMLLLYSWLFRRLGEPWANILRNWMHGNGKTWGEMGGKMFQLLKLWWAVCIVLLIESSNILCLV